MARKKAEYRGPDETDIAAGAAKKSLKSYGHYMEELQRKNVVVIQCDGVERKTVRERMQEERERRIEMGELKAGDTVKCFNHEDMRHVLESLKKQGYKADYLYEKDGKEGMWIIIK